VGRDESLESIVKELRWISSKLFEIAREVDFAEKNRSEKRPFFKLVQVGSVWRSQYASFLEATRSSGRQDLWMSVPEMTQNTVRTLDEIVHRCERALESLRVLGSAKVFQEE